MDTIATEDDLKAIESPHQPDYDSIGGCVCGESYPCTTRGLVAEVRRLRADKEALSSALRMAASTFRSKAVSADSMRRQADGWYDIADRHGTPHPLAADMEGVFARDRNAEPA